MRKVAEHVYDKVLGAGSDLNMIPGGGNTVSSGSPAGDRANTDSNADNSSLAEEKVELLCNDQLLDPSMDLRTVNFTMPNQTNSLSNMFLTNIYSFKPFFIFRSNILYGRCRQKYTSTIGPSSS